MPKKLGMARRLQAALDIETIRMEGSLRRPGRSWLLNPRRLEIVLSAAVYPGLHLRSASRLLLQPLPSLRFHIQKLAANGFIATRSLRGRVVLFIPGLYPHSVEAILAAWEDPDARAVLKALHASPKSPKDRIAAATGLGDRAVVRALSLGESSGAVRRSGTGAERFLLTPQWESFERLSHDGADARLEQLLALFRREDLHPVAEAMGAGLYRMTVDGPRSRIRFSLPLDPVRRG